MKKLLILFLPLLILTFGHLYGQSPGIVSYSYWFNHDFSGITTHSIAADSMPEIDLAVPVSNLPAGLHVFHISFKDSNLKSSSVSSSWFFNHAETAITGYEYWFDHSFEARVTLNHPGTQLLNLDSAFSAASLLPGMHTVHFRFRNATGLWSTVETQPFFKLAGGANQNRITAFEYWFDNHPEFKISLAMDVEAHGEISLPIDANSIPDGWHRMHSRFLSDDFSSTVSTSYFYKSSTTQVDAQKIAGYRLLFNQDSRTLRNIDFPVPATEVVLIDPFLELPYLPPGKHLFSIDFRDLSGHYSSVYSDSILVTQCLPYPAKPIQGIDQFCAGRGGMAFTIPPITNATSYVWSVPAGATIVSGDSTNTIVVDFSEEAQSGMITASGVNPCGVGVSAELAISVIPSPVAQITGEETVCTETAGAVYSTDPGYMTYEWSLGAGGQIVSGQGTSSVTVDWGAVPGTWALNVSYVSDESCSGSSVKEIYVRPVPPSSVAAPGIVIPDSLTYCNESSQVLTLPHNGEPFTVEAGGAAYLLAGMKIRMLPGFRVDSLGYLHAYITSDCFYCDAIPHDLPEPVSHGNNPLHKELESGNWSHSRGHLKFKAWPNPTSGRFALEFEGVTKETGSFQVEIFTLQGVRIMDFHHEAPVNSLDYSLEGFPAGVYLVKVTTNTGSGTVRMIRN